MRGFVKSEASVEEGFRTSGDIISQPANGCPSTGKSRADIPLSRNFEVNCESMGRPF